MSTAVLEPRVINLKTLHHQQALLDSELFSCCMVGGIGCGKSRGLAYDMFVWVKEESPMSPGVVCAPTHDQLDHATLATFKELLVDCGIDFVHNKKPPKEWNVPISKKYDKFDNILTLKTGHIFVAVSLDEPENARGPEYGAAWIDEIASCTENAYKIILGRVRCKYAKRHRIRGATSPKGMNWFYEWFADPSKKKPGHGFFHATTMDNPFVPEMYKDILRNYDPETYAQEAMGQFVKSGSSRLFSEWEPTLEGNLKEWKFDRNLHVHVGCDFNVSPLAWVVAQIDPVSGHIHVFDEVFIQAEATTHDACEILCSKYPGVNKYAYPDATCKRKTTSGKGSLSDWTVLEEYGLKPILAQGKNPFIEETVEYVQKRLREKTLWVDPRCTNLIESMNKTMSMKGSRKPIKCTHPGQIGEHPTDALRYLVYNYDHESFIYAYSW